MEYHLEHHMFPNIPSYNLKKLNKVIQDQLPKPKEGIFDAYRAIIPTLIKQAKNPYYILTFFDNTNRIIPKRYCIITKRTIEIL